MGKIIKNTIMIQIIDNKVVRVSESLTDVSSAEINEQIKSIDNTIDELNKAKEVYLTELEKVIELEKQLSNQKRKLK